MDRLIPRPLPEINLKYIRRVLRFIERGDHRRFSMDTYMLAMPGASKRLLKEVGMPECGTVACFAGWGVLLQMPKNKWQHPIPHREIRNKATKLFGFTEEEADSVFLGLAFSQIGFDNEFKLLKKSINDVLERRGMKERV